MNANANTGLPAAGPETGPPQSGLSDLDVIFGRTWAVFRRRWPVCMAIFWGAAAVVMTVLMATNLVLSILNVLAGDPAFYNVLLYVYFVALCLVPFWAWIGMKLAMLKLARQELSTLEDLLRGFPYLLGTIVALALLLAIASVPFLLVQFLTAEIMELYADTWWAWLAIALAGTALSGAAVLPALARFGLFPFALIDLGLGPVQALSYSWRCTRGRAAASSFLVGLAYIALNLAGLLAFFVGLAVTLPLSSLLLAMRYDVLSARHGHEIWMAPADDRGPAEAEWPPSV